MESRFSVIIPTLFRRPDILNNLLGTLYDDPAVSEVIILDNTEYTDETIVPLEVNDKTKIHSAGRNRYVNPSWNYGVQEAEEKYIAILNDDITIPEGIFTSISQIDLKPMGVIGACHPMIQQVENPQRFSIEKGELVPISERIWGFGIFMAMHKDNYIPIPDEIKVWCGDDIIFHGNRLAGRENYLLVAPIQTRMSTTSDDKQFDEIKENDVKLYNLKYKAMSITERYGFKTKYDQFGNNVEENFYDKDELILIEEFEKCVLDLKKDNRVSYTMLELGSNQCYYSMLFKSILRDSEVLNIMVEPTDGYMERGKESFALNNFEGVFINKCIGKTWIAHNTQFNKDETSVDALLEEYKIESLDVLHSDIDGAELTMLEGATESLKSKRIKYAFILTHGIDTHSKCLEFVHNFDYDVIMNHTQDNIGADRLIIIKSR